MATNGQTIKYRLRQLNNANNNAHLLQQADFVLPKLKTIFYSTN